MMITFANPLQLVGNLKAALLAAATDETRPSLSSVLIEFGNATGEGRARFVATNGYWLWINEISADVISGIDEKGRQVLDREASARLLISRKDAARIVRGIGTAKRQASFGVVLDVVTSKVQIGGSVVDFEPVDAVFPPYAQVLPSEKYMQKPCSSMAFSSEYLVAVCEAFTHAASYKATKVMPGAGVRLHFGSTDLDPAVATSHHLPEALAIIMPKRDDGAKQGRALLERYRDAAKSA